MFILWIFAITSFAAFTGPACSTEYFAGPFASWLNVQSAPFNATGNGATDDTAALQAAINDYSGFHSVIYLPAGTYKISAPLTVQNLSAFSFIGASPAATTILWAGPSGGTMMQVNATTHANWGRITWQGSGTAGIGVAHTCTGSGGSCSSGYAPTNLLHFDEVFLDMGKGIAGGVNQAADNSEMTITRCTFSNCTYAGISVESYNALDYWAWDSQFYNCARGLTNDVSGGNFMAYRCLFENSTIADLKFTNAGFFSFRNNVSINSNQFVNGLGSNSAVECSIQGNRVVTTTNPTAIYLNNPGPALLVDNQIQSQSGATAAAVSMITLNGSDVGGPDLISIGNQYTVSNPITVIGQVLASGQTVRWWSQEDQIVSYGSISSAPPTMPALPTQLNTNITDMPVGSSAAAIQAAINAATGTDPVIHLPAGSYSLNQTLTLPANENIFIVGDNQQTGLNWNGTAIGFQLQGPSKATLRDMFLSGPTGDVIQVLNADQTGGRVFSDGMYMSNNKTGDLLADTLANTHVDMQGFQPSRYSLVSMKSVGTGSPSSGDSRVGLYGAAAGGISQTSGWMYEVSNGGKMLVEDAWYESGNCPTIVNLVSPDSGVFSFWGGNLGQGSNGTDTSPGPPVNVNNFNGLASFLNLNYGMQNGSEITVVDSSTSTSTFFLGQVSNLNPYYSSSGGGGAGGGGQAYFDNNKGNSNQQLPNQPAPSPVPTPPAPSSFVDSQLNLARTELADPVTDLAPGVTDARLYRLSIANSGLGLHIVGSGSAPTPPPTTSSSTAVPTPVGPYVFPQPAQDPMTIVYSCPSSQQVRVNIYAFSAEEVASFTQNAQAINNNQLGLSVKSFAPGVYFYVIHGTGSGGVLAKGKFLVTH